jgi:hypothetical protein
VIAPPPAPEPIRFDLLLGQSWTLFRRNWIVALPPVIGFGVSFVAVIAFAAAVVVVALAHGGFERGGNGFIAAFVVGYLGLMVLAVVVSIWAYAAMFGMADAVWARGTTSFGDGFAAFRTRWAALVVAGIGFAGVMIAAVVLALPTLFLSFLALPLFTMYVLPSVIGGGRGGFAAVGESFRLVRDFFGVSAISCLVLAGIQYGVSLLSTFAILPLEFSIIPTTPNGAPHMPPMWLLAGSGSFFVLGMLGAFAYSGYHTIAVVGLYRSLAAQPSPDAARPPARSFSG